MKFKLIIFDLDDTLIDSFGSCLPLKMKLALRGMVSAGLKINDFDKSYKRLLELNETRVNGTEALKSFLHEINAGDNFLEIGRDCYYGKSEENYEINPLPNTLTVLAELSKNHVLALVTFGNEEEQWEKINGAGINPDWFEEIQVTQNYDKCENYKKLMEKFGYSPQEIVVVGDKVDSDLIPAKKLGMIAVHMRWGRGKLLKPKEGDVDYSVNNLNELINIVESK
jgi:putative hydrolase of the HAD superfamily